MKTNTGSVLAINGGSSSIKFAIYKIDEALAPLFVGQITGIGTLNTEFSFTDSCTGKTTRFNLKAASHYAAATSLLDWLAKQAGCDVIRIIGHRIVHGMKHQVPEIITPELLTELRELSAFDPEHLPEEINLVEMFKNRYPSCIQVACFDTSFHASMPIIAKLLPIPRRYQELGIQRYGFHGLSYSYLLEELKQMAGNTVANGRVILAHLGSGASLAAIHNGHCMDTSMGFTPSSGLPMSTRTGDLDPGVAYYIIKTENLSSAEFSHLINKESGLLGVSETSSDMQELLTRQHADCRAAEAVELFCYQTKKWIGSFASVLGGLDTLVFSGGIGEHSAEVRARICQGLQFLGIALNESRNINHSTIISEDKSKVCVRVVPTNEELMIARLVNPFLKNNS